MPSGMERASLTTTPEHVDHGPRRRRGQAPPALGHADPAAGEPVDAGAPGSVPRRWPGTAVAGRMAGP